MQQLQQHNDRLEAAAVGGARTVSFRHYSAPLRTRVLRKTMHACSNTPHDRLHAFCRHTHACTHQTEG
jgi:hypothetical protein